MDPCAANDLSNHTVYINHLLRASVDFVGKVVSLFFNMLSRFVIAFLPRSKRLLILWLQSPSAMILEPKIIKSVTVSIVSPSIHYKSFLFCSLWELYLFVLVDPLEMDFVPYKH